MEFYLIERPMEEFRQGGRRFGVDWEDPQADPVPTRDQILLYQEELERLATATLESLDEAAFLAPEQFRPWTGANRLAKYLYLLRHTQQHIGDINRVLAYHGRPVLEWH